MGRWQELQQAMSAGVEAAIDAGWDRQAVYGLVESAKDTRLPLEQAKTAVAELFSEVEEVGSSAYERLFRFFGLSSARKLVTVMAIRCSVGSAWHVAISRTLSFRRRRRLHRDVLGFVGKNSSKAYPLGLLGSFNQEKAKRYIN